MQELKWKRAERERKRGRMGEHPKFKSNTQCHFYSHTLFVIVEHSVRVLVAIVDGDRKPRMRRSVECNALIFIFISKHKICFHMLLHLLVHARAHTHTHTNHFHSLAAFFAFYTHRTRNICLHRCVLFTHSSTHPSFYVLDQLASFAFVGLVRSVRLGFSLRSFLFSLCSIQSLSNISTLSQCQWWRWRWR